MNTKFAITCVAVGALLGTAAAMAAEESDATHAVAYVKDSAITTEIKTKLAAEHLSSLEHIHVGTDADGVVWLSGSASTREAADRAVSIARDTSGVTRVHSNIKVRSND
jgi:hyperosmotically inducible protein